MYKLDWDSKFWGVEIFNLDIDNNKPNLNEIKRIVNLHDNYLIQALVSNKNNKQINLLEEIGFKFIDIKIILKKIVNNKIKLDVTNFKKVDKAELYCYKDEFYNLYGSLSRFSLFPKKKVNDFYYKWALNSIDGNMDNKCIGYYINKQLAGFITLKYKNYKVIIGLLGVFPGFQRRGISQKLLDYVVLDAMSQSCRELSVSTQGKNLMAINAYIKNGFFIDDIKHWYYLKGEKL